MMNHVIEVIIIIIGCQLLILFTKTCQPVEEESQKYELLKNPRSGQQLCLHLQESNTAVFRTRSAVECCSSCEILKIYNAVNFYNDNRTCAMLYIAIEHDAILNASQTESNCQSYMKSEVISEIVRTTTPPTTTTLQTTGALSSTRTLKVTATTPVLTTSTATTRKTTTTTTEEQTTTTQCLTIPSYPYINSSLCEFPFTYSGRLYHKCTDSLPPLQNPCDEYFCLSKSRDVSICINPFDYFGTNITTTISVPNFPPVTVTSVNNWIIVQQRIDKTVSFDRNWTEYKIGFGVYNGNFWFGLEKLYQLTSSGSYRLRFQVLVSGEWYTDEYDRFIIDSEANDYAIRVYNYIGDNIDILNLPPLDNTARLHNGMRFSTGDRLDKYSCAKFYRSGNWFNNCFGQNINANLSGQFLYTTSKTNYWTPMTYSRIMIKSNTV